MKNRISHKRRRRGYRKVMASLTGAALLSTAMLGAPTAKASESVKSSGSTSGDILSEILLKSKDEIQERVKDKIAEKAAEAIQSVKMNPEIVNEAWTKTKEAIGERVKAEIEEVVLEKKAELEEAVAERWNPKKNQANRVLDVKATAYTSGPEDNGIWNDKTHIGTKVRPGIVAVDPKVIPLGSKVYVELADGTGVHLVAEDTGGAIKGNRIDIALSDRDKVRKFGIQDAKVHVLEEGTLI